MARPTRRADEASPKDVHDLGVRGRKTGVTLRGRGRLDEFGMLPLADISSSPVPNTVQNKAPMPDSVQEPVAVPAPAPEPILQATPDHRGNDSGSDAMDIPSSAGPGPRTILIKRSISIGLPKSRSPVKMHAKSFRPPAKRTPNLSPRRISSTPTDLSMVKQPDFANLPAQGEDSNHLPVISEPRSDDSNSISSGDSHMEISDMVGQSNQMLTRPPERTIRTANEYQPRISQQETTLVGMSDKAKGKQKAPAINPIAQASPKRPASVLRSPSPQQPVQEPESSLYVPYDPDPSPSPGPAQPDYSSPPEPVREPSITKPSPLSKPPKRTTPVISAPHAAKRRTHDDGEDAGGNQEKRPRWAESAVSRQSEQPVKRGRGRPPKNGIAKRGRGRPRKSDVESDGEEGESLMTLQRGPPMPKSRGLVSMRRDATSTTAGRSRSRSYNDADWWADIQGSEPAYEPQLPRGQRLGSHAAATAATTQRLRRPGSAMVDEDNEPEDWELEPGTVTGEIVLWEPEHEAQPPGPDDPVQVTDELIATTADAIQTTEISNSDARYARTLTLPFMGAGIVDLPPGSEKRPKNSRKMHLVFFVHYGKVTVSVNEVQFRISAGGMWFVPRGNYYNIANDYDFPARVYFAQACEVLSPSADIGDVTQQTIIT